MPNPWPNIAKIVLPKVPPNPSVERDAERNSAVPLTFTFGVISGPKECEG